MNSRFAEICRLTPLDLDDVEFEIERLATDDGRNAKDRLLDCVKEIYIGVFFDGTNNNKYRDTPSYSQSNVARLYEVYPGNKAEQRLPPRVNPDRSTTPRDRSEDKNFFPDSMASADHQYYRKVYVPGVGTAMPDVGDSGIEWDRTGGLVGAFLGQARLEWASLQFVNQVHAAVFKTPLENSVLLTDRWGPGMARMARLTPLFDLGGQWMAQMAARLRASLVELEAIPTMLDRFKLEDTLAVYERRLAAALKLRGANKPSLRKIRLSVFGFSRGSAAARAWVNIVEQRWGAALAGIPLQIDFLGIFDTVASVGLAQSTPGFEGHGGWAGNAFMPVPASVKRCVHLVASSEVRGSFPLDSVSRGGFLPANCKEIVYPGVHSDVGGGYAPDDQGRALGAGAAGDPSKLSQVPLAQMYREARMAGVPLAPSTFMLAPQKKSFEIAPQLRDDFNQYVAATRSGTIPPTQGKGEPDFARMYPTETQPREELFRLMRRHYGYTLRWRKAVMNSAGGIAAGDALAKASSIKRFQDIEDFRGAEEELKKELLFLVSGDPRKFETVDDPLLGYFEMTFDALASSAPVLFPLRSIFPALLRDKQRQWDTWIQHEWASHAPDALPSAAVRLFDYHVHDSRAWFKPLRRSDGQGMAPNDEDWFFFGEREREGSKRAAELAAALKKAQASGDRQAADKAEAGLKQLSRPGEPLIHGGREPYRMWGYLRHRMLYESGKLSDKNWTTRQETVGLEEQERVARQRREDMLAAENARHDAEVRKIQAFNRDRVAGGRLAGDALSEFNEATRAQLLREQRLHDERLLAISGVKAGP